VQRRDVRARGAAVKQDAVKQNAVAHDVSIHCERGAYMPHDGHRAHCSCGWWSDCYVQLSDTQRAIEVHLRRAGRVDFDALIARSSIGAAIDDVKKRGIDAHLIDLEREMNRRRPTKKKPAKKTLSAEDAAFMRGFGTALASIWRCHHDGQMVACLIKENNFTIDEFRDVGLFDDDWRVICRAVRR
jgi:hypothetical protein